MAENNERTTGAGSERPPGLRWTFFEEWIEAQVDRQDQTGAIARFILADIERGCWEEVFDFDYYRMREEKMRQGMVRHLILHHNLSGKTLIAFERVHKEFVEAKERNLTEVIAWHKEYREKHGESFDPFDPFQRT